MAGGNKLFKKKLVPILISTLIVLGTSVFFHNPVSATITNGWTQSGSNWKYSINGSYENGWLLYNTKWYHFNADSNMDTGWIQYANKWYLMSSNGDMQIGWLLQNSKWYYLNSNGSRADNSWILYNSKWYYLGSNGEMAVSTTTPDGYVVGTDGAWTGGKSDTTSNAPQNLTASAISSSAISLHWTKVDDADYYYVYYSFDNKTFNPILLSNNTKQKFQWASNYSASLTGLTPVTKVYFKITAVKGSTESSYSEVANAATSAGPVVPPNELDAETVSSVSMNLTWDAVIGADSYNVYYRKSTSTEYTKIKSVKNSYTLLGLTAATTYYFKVTTIKGLIESNYSPIVSADTASISAPIDVKAQASASNSIIVTWAKVTGADSYYVYYKQSGDDYYTSVECTTNSYTLTDIDTGTKVNFKVTAVKGDAESAISAIVNATTGASSVASPSGVKAQVASSSSLEFYWNTVAGADYYYAYYRLSSDSEYTQVKKTTNYFVLNDLDPETRIYFRVTAVKSGIESNYSSTTYATTESE